MFLLDKRIIILFLSTIIILMGAIYTGELSLSEAQDVISWEDAHRYYGEFKTVEGVVVRSHNSGKAVFLNFHPNWKRYFTAVIFARDFHKFPESPEKHYLNKRVRITGKIKEYQGKPEIILQSPDAIQILYHRPDPGGTVLEGVLVEKVADGDTISIRYRGDQYTVRLIGVDTPETAHPLKPVQYFADEATRFTKTLAEGKVVRLEFDWQRLDKYDRLLAYIYLPDGRMLNAEIIKQGFGFAYVKYHFKHLDLFRQLESEARTGGRGLWDGEGHKELRWLQEQQREPILLTLTSRCTWEISYLKYVRNVPVAEIPISLSDLRLWTNEYAPQDLDLRLKQAGWKIKPGSDGEKISAYEMTNIRWGFVSRFGERVNILQEGIPSFLTETQQQVCRN
ncbi:MAG: thermonuclease family protein [Nitrospirae bacterium]|nr:thermonuclease family protein [Nitrospirota bacterium]